MQLTLTVIVAGRNDDYGKDFRERLFRTALHNCALLSGKGIEFEELLAEWNPLPDRPPLSEEFVARVPNARTVIIPPEIHRKYSLNPKMPFHEMAAKNAAIRRARGEVVVVTNADILFSEQLVDRIAAGTWRSDTLYRAHRIDVKPELDWAAIQDPANQLASGEGTQCPPYYLGAGGDFCLGARRLWHSLGGFNERIRFSTRAKDWQFFLSAAAQGIQIEFIGNVYHLDHEGGFLNTSPGARNTDSVHFGRWWDIEFGLPVSNANDWGFSGVREDAWRRDSRIAVLASKDYVVPEEESRLDREMLTWLTCPAESTETSTAVLLHAICAAHRERRRLICRVKEPRFAATLAGFGSVASQFGVELYCNWNWPLLPGYTVAPFESEPALRQNDWIVEEDRVCESGSGRSIDVLPKTVPMNEPEFNPVLSRRLLRAYLRLQQQKLNRVAIYGGGSHTRSLMSWGIPDSIELVGLVESDSRVAAKECSHGRRPWLGIGEAHEPRSGERIFRRYAAHADQTIDHGLQPWLHSFAATRLSEFATHAQNDTALLLSSASFESDMLQACRDRGIANVIPLYTDWPPAVAKAYA